MDGTVTAGRKGIPYLRDHFEPEMSALATERAERERSGPAEAVDRDPGSLAHAMANESDAVEATGAER